MLTREQLIAVIKQDGTNALAMAQGSSLAQIEAAANTRFANVADLYVYLRDQKVWTVKIKADSIYKCVRNNKFTGRNWRVLTPSFDDIVSFQTFEIEGQNMEACLVVGVARAERALAARISKEKSRLQAAYETMTGYAHYNPEPPSQPASETKKPETDTIDAEFVEVPEAALPAPSEEKPEAAKPAPSEEKPEAAKPAPSEEKPEAAKPLHLEVGVINSDRSALEAILSALVKTKSNSNKTELLAFRSEVRQALVSAGLLEDK